MLNSKALTELFSKNSDDNLCKQWFLMTPNGTLLAYTQPTNLRELRKQTAMATLSWSEYRESRTGPGDTNGEPAEATVPGSLRTLTIESESSNTIIRQIQPQLLLVLEGGVPPRKESFEPRVTPEGINDAPYPLLEGAIEAVLSSSESSSTADSTTSRANSGVLRIQRGKMDALATVIAQNFEQTGFKMPEEGSTKFF